MRLKNQRNYFVHTACARKVRGRKMQIVSDYNLITLCVWIKKMSDLNLYVALNDWSYVEVLGAPQIKY